MVNFYPLTGCILGQIYSIVCSLHFFHLAVIPAISDEIDKFDRREGETKSGRFYTLQTVFLQDETPGL